MSRRYKATQECVKCSQQRHSGTLDALIPGIAPSVRKRPIPEHKPRHLIDGKEVALSPLEDDVFSMLFNARGRVLSRDALHKGMYGRPLDGGPGDKIVLVYIYKLRRKLQETNFKITTRHTHGWSLERAA